MRHVHFLSNNKSVCEKPGMLGLDAVVVDYTDAICKVCSGLIMAYNDRIRNYDLALSLPAGKRPPSLRSFTVRELSLALLFISVFWISFFIIGVKVVS